MKHINLMKVKDLSYIDSDIYREFCRKNKIKIATILYENIGFHYNNFVIDTSSKNFFQFDISTMSWINQHKKLQNIFPYLYTVLSPLKEN